MTNTKFHTTFAKNATTEDTRDSVTVVVEVQTASGTTLKVAVADTGNVGSIKLAISSTIGCSTGCQNIFLEHFEQPLSNNTCIRTILGGLLFLVLDGNDDRELYEYHNIVVAVEFLLV
jgi:hypothetical protein